jgi:L-amino acid N-acyltransferase YncA
MSKIRKIQHRADKRVSDRRKLAAMTPKEREDNTSELARRELLSRVLSSQLIRCDWIETTSDMGYPLFRPAVSEKLASYGVASFESSGAVLLAVPKSVYVADALKSRGVESVKIDKAIESYLRDEAMPEICREVVGHRSYQDTAVKASDDFSHTNVRLSSHASWSGSYEQWPYAGSDGAKVINVLTTIYGLKLNLYRYDWTPDNANFSAQAESRWWTGASYAGSNFSPSVRCASASNTHYTLRYFSGIVMIQRWKNGSAANLASQSGIGRDPRTLRIEVSGTGASVSLVGYYGGESVAISANDDHANRIVDTGYAGIFCISAHNITGNDAYLDDFVALQGVAAGGAGGLDAGAFGLGRGGRGLSPNAGGL